jgi:hypothetical protein
MDQIGSLQPSSFLGAHPFGGSNMSGMDSKSGGLDYMVLFLQPFGMPRN